MNIKTTCRDVAELKPVAQTALKLLVQECVKAGVANIFITETYRSPARQKYLYAQGRTRTGQIVTWTLNSNHASRLAWDIAISPPAALYDVATLNKVGAIARKLGITWGGDWKKNIDRPHFEVKATWTAPAGYKLEGEVIVPTSTKERAQLIKKPATVSKPHRVKSGAFNTADAAKQAQVLMDRHGIASSKWSKVVRDGTVWRVLTGTFASKEAAESAIKRMQQKGILKTAYAVK